MLGQRKGLMVDKTLMDINCKVGGWGVLPSPVGMEAAGHMQLCSLSFLLGYLRVAAVEALSRRPLAPGVGPVKVGGWVHCGALCALDFTRAIVRCSHWLPQLDAYVTLCVLRSAMLAQVSGLLSG